MFRQDRSSSVAAKRLVSAVVIVSALPLTCACSPKLGPDENPTALAVLESKTDQASPRDRCFLYAELVSEMTEVARKQLSAGDSGRALESLRLVRRYADKTLQDVADDSRKLKGAELLMRHTSFRLEDMLHQASYDDRHDVEETLKELHSVQTQLIMRVFKK
jgi:hypothetical protein